MRLRISATASKVSSAEVEVSKKTAMRDSLPFFRVFSSSSGRMAEGILLFSMVPRPRTVSTWSISLIFSSSLACSVMGKSSVIIMEKAPLPKSSKSSF